MKISDHGRLPANRCFWSVSIILIGWLWVSDVQAQIRVKELFTLPSDQRIVNLIARPIFNLSDSLGTTNSIDSIIALAKNESDQPLYWYAHIVRLRFQLSFHVDRKNKAELASGIHILETYRRSLENCPLPITTAGYWHIYGSFLIDHLQLDEGFRYMLRAMQRFEQIGYDKDPQGFEHLYGIGTIYYRFGDYPTAIRYLSLAERYQPRLPMRLRTAALNTLGVAYQELKAYDKALITFRKALNQARLNQDSAYLSVVTGNIGNTLRLQGRTRQALPYLYQDLAFGESIVPENCAITCLFIAKALLSLDSTRKAHDYISRSRRLMAGQLVRNEYYVNYSEVQALYARKTGNLQQALFWTDSTTRLTDSLRTIFDSKRLTANESRLNAQRYLATLQHVKAQKEQAELIRNLSIGALLLLTILGVYALNQNRQKLRLQEKRQAEQLAHATDQLTQYINSLQDKNELIDQISAELALALRSSSNPPEADQHLDTLRNSVILTEKDWLQFRHLFEQVHPRFFETLRQQVADLSPTELRLLALTKLGLPTKEMAYMLGVSVDAIRKSRHRLRKKLEHQSPNTALEELLARL
ncbi:tetratricopeptide repeat protein [Spirosoma sp. BT702]|uniref:Tetratricopeptide repeat protein n=1 Tax=Spirosoma profusum TaxID=2771354 RepID=A0A926Y517_9BACT|nr:tetratricopeptide repeat protein [Spirosoma profusum]MBD2703896.1 tetratricopeptide repeat protein [Spirosoma profusum]